MYQKILVPLDRSDRGRGGVLAMAKNLLAPGGEGILLHVLSPGVPITVGLYIVPAAHVEEDECARVKAYLNCFANHLNQASDQWRCAVTVSSSVSKGIVDFAIREKVDLIAMYSHDMTGLAKLIRGSIAEKVLQRSPIEVRVLKPRELVAT